MDWLNFVVTPTAKNRIRQWYKKSHRDETIKRGRDLLEKEVGRNGFETLLSSDAMKKVANRCNLKNTEDLLASLGFGGLTLHQVLNRLREEIKLQTEDIKNDSDSEIAKSLKSNSNLSTNKPYTTTKSPISGIEGLDYRIGKCCSPLPGEDTVSYTHLTLPTICSV